MARHIWPGPPGAHLSATHFQDDVDIVLVLKVAVEGHHMATVQVLVQLYLPQDLNTQHNRAALCAGINGHNNRQDNIHLHLNKKKKRNVQHYGCG